MTYEEFIQQFIIHNHAGEFANDEVEIGVATRVADSLVKKHLLTPKNSQKNGKNEN